MGALLGEADCHLGCGAVRGLGVGDDVMDGFIEETEDIFTGF